MNKAVRKEDPIILICAAVLALGVGGWVIKSALDFGKESEAAQLPELEEPELGETPAALALARTADLRAATDAGNFPRWNTAEASGRERGFLVSTPLVFKGSAGSGEVLDLDKEDPVLRAPIPNAWLTKHRLNSNYANVGNLDPDGDKFTNEEEYLWGVELGQEFDPNNKDSHPPLYYKLVYDRLVSDPYVIQFKMIAKPNDFQLKHPDTINRKERWTYYGNRSKLGERFPDRENSAKERFSVEKLGEADPIVATLRDHSRGEGHPKGRADIPADGSFDFGDQFALMGYAVDQGTALKLELLKSAESSPEGLENYTIRLIDVAEGQAVIEITDKATDKKTTLTFEKGTPITPTRKP